LPLLWTHTLGLCVSQEEGIELYTNSLRKKKKVVHKVIEEFADCKCFSLHLWIISRAGRKKRRRYEIEEKLLLT